MTQLKASLLIFLSFLALGLIVSNKFLPEAKAFQLEGCRQGSPTVYYYNGADSVESQYVPLAAESWNDMPAQVFLIPISSPTASSTNIIIQSVFVQGGVLAQISYTCVPPYFSGKTTIALNDWALGCNHTSPGCQDSIIQVIAHELGHALGLDHSTVNWSLMWPDNSNWQEYRIFVPVLDDAKGLAQWYGQNHDTSFASSSASGGSASGTTLPLTLQVTTPSSSSYAKVYSSTSLPSSQLAVMISQVSAQTLYRFNIAWRQGSGGPYVAEELDNDGAKLVYLSGTTPAVLILQTQRNQTSSQHIPALGALVWLEVVVEEVNGTQNSIGIVLSLRR